jgi:BRCA1-associated protein
MNGTHIFIGNRVSLVSVRHMSDIGQSQTINNSIKLLPTMEDTHHTSTPAAASRTRRKRAPNQHSNTRPPLSPGVEARPVTFGNPALGTYHGVIYTRENEQQQQQPPPRIDAELVENVAAMVSVPPEQIPEGVLNLARSHRPWIRHVRLFLADAAAAEDAPMVSSTSSDSLQDDSPSTRQPSGETRQFGLDKPDATMSPTSPSTRLSFSAAENAAAILAADEENEEDDRVDLLRVDQSLRHRPKQSLSYLVLFEMVDQESTQVLVNELHNQPYTSLDETCCCSMYHVLALQSSGHRDHASLLTPFFSGLSIRHHNVSQAPRDHPEAAAIDHNEAIRRSRSRTASSATEADTAMMIKPAASVNQGDDDYCAVCLEQMELHGDDNNDECVAILTTVCNHSFHMDCLLRGWQDSPCPVCRYDHASVNETLSQCHVCSTTDHNYVCLICGVISCGNSGTATGDATSSTAWAAAKAHSLPASSVDAMESSVVAGYAQLWHSHARQHYDETLHAYALDTESQHVFDFAGGGFVHRLLQNKDDGKIVEVNDPYQRSSNSRSQTPGLSERQEGEIVHRKLEGFATQYYTLLRSQLEQQRAYYEERLDELRREHSDADPKNGKNQGKSAATDLIAALKQEKYQLLQRLESTSNRLEKVRDDATFLRNMNESLESNLAALKQEIVHAQQQRRETSAMFRDCLLPPLREKVTSLMLQLEN